MGIEAGKTVNNTDYKTINSQIDCDVKELFSHFRKAEMCLKSCMQCPNYGQIWSCPPLGFEPEEKYGKYGKCRLFMTKIIPLKKGTNLREAEGYIMKERPGIEIMLLDEEVKLNGRAMAFVGKCLYCPGQKCARTEGGECRHPEKIRPSLEACGFDVTAISSHYFNTEIKWSGDGHAPEYLTLITALFYD